MNLNFREVAETIRNAAKLDAIKRLLQNIVDDSENSFDDLALDMFYKFLDNDDLFELFVGVVEKVLGGEKPVDIWKFANSDARFAAEFSGIGTNDRVKAFYALMEIIKIVLPYLKLLL